MSSPDTSMPLMGEQAVIDTLSPAPDTSNLPVDTRTAPQGPQPTGPTTTTNLSDVPSGPSKASLWRNILSGALQGLAAGSAVNTKGMSPGSAIAAGAGAGVNQVINTVPQQSAALDLQKSQVAFHYAQLAHVQREMNLMPDDKREAYLNSAADTYSDMLKSGAVVPMSQPSDLVSAQNTLQQLHGKNPWAVYSIMPVHGEDGEIQFSAVQFPKAPTQEDLTLTDPSGNKITVTRGTPAEKIGMFFTNQISKQLDRDSKENIAGQNNATKAATAAARAAQKPDRNLYEGVDATGNSVAGTADELNAAGIRNYAKMPALTQTQTLAARELTAPNGLFQTAAQQVRALNQAGKLGPVASRWNNFWAAKGLEGDQQAFRDTLGLIATKLMQAHMGNRGGRDAMEHFAALVPENGTPDVLMKTLNNEYQYVNALAKRPKAVNNGQ